jgi:hypothetical protein
MIDSTAFILYGHWIKKDEHQNQNRATLFQTEEKCDLVRHEQRILDRQASPPNRLHRQSEFEDDKQSVISSN